MEKPSDGLKSTFAPPALFGLTALLVLATVVVQVILAAQNTSGHFTTPLARGLNVFAFFTIESNLLLAWGCALLALRLDRTSNPFRILRLCGVVAIAIVGVCFHTLLSGTTELAGWSKATDFVLHTLVPILAVLGWLLFGPRGLTSMRTAGVALIYPVAYLVFTMTRGAVVNWYPYYFLDPKIGWGNVTLYLLGILVLFLAVAAALVLVDPRLSRRKASL